MIHLFINEAGELMAFENVPEKPTLGKCSEEPIMNCYDLNPKCICAKEWKEYAAALESAKASAVKVKNVKEALDVLWDKFAPTLAKRHSYTMTRGKIYSLEGYKMEIEVICCDGVSLFELCEKDCNACISFQKADRSHRVAIISPIQEQKEESQEVIWKEMFQQIASRIDFIKFVQKHYHITRKQSQP